MAVLQLQDGSSNLGMVTNFLSMGSIVSITNSFTDSAFINIADFAPATPYPSTINVAGVTGTVTKVTATLAGLSHTYPLDVQVLLVGPGGQTVLLLSDAGDQASITNVTLTFDDSAASLVPAASRIFSGTYRPTDYPPDYSMPAPAPSGPYGNNLSIFNGLDPAGTWSLFVADDSVGDAGSIARGWT